MAQQAITIRIGEIAIPLNIESGKEEVYRLAEREVNRYLAEIQAHKLKDWTDKHYLAMAAMRFAINSVRDRRRTETDDEDLRKLEALSAEIDAYLNTPTE